MMRFLIPLIGLFLFYLEPVFGLFSPLQIGGEYYYVVPRFLIMFLIFVSVYFDTKHAMFYGLFFGLLYDVFFIDIIGLYSFLYPAICVLAGYIVKNLQRNLYITTMVTLVLTAAFEFILYQFFSLISLTSIPIGTFFDTRLMPTMIANSMFLVILGWAFRSMIVGRFEARRKNPSLSRFNG
ncbi:rod shape-determining protein MreD [Planococcus shenhongbingii]|uniref:rod shape-determining protein MreD n=1 Tax=Planococcus TaxID=1372 RepID=UPI00260D04BD|nr:rod shape-determining protein MreD [Planococcus sp. N016]WKA60016.1 rod shape-determining protein MreD [Planococcus sp. N016]